MLVLKQQQDGIDICFATNEQKNQATAQIIALYTDTRVSGERGWWGGEIGSTLWTFTKHNESTTQEQVKQSADSAIATTKTSATINIL